jgi:two-component system cell cycle response regulator
VGEAVRKSEVGANLDSQKNKLISHSMPQSVRASINLPTVLAGLGEEIFSLPDVDGGAINLVNDTQDALVTAHLKLPAEFAGVQTGYKGFHYRFNQPDINVLVYQNGTSEIVAESNLDNYAEMTRIRFRRWKMRSLLVIPLIVAQENGVLKTIGTASVFSQHRVFDIALADKIKAITKIYSAQLHTLWNQHLAIERVNIADAMNDNMQQFFSCVTEMNSLTTVNEVYSLIAREFIRQFRFDAVSILMATEDKLRIEKVAFSEAYKPLLSEYEPIAQNIAYSFNVSDGQCGFVYTHNQAFHVEDVAEIMHLQMSEKDRMFVDILKTPRTLLIVPIRLNAKVIGVMSLVTLEQIRPLSETDLKLIELLASFSSTAIRNAKAHELVEQKNREIELLNQDLKIQMVFLDHVARKDHLTGLNNFGSFEEELKRRTSEYLRKNDENSLSFILFDVDHFKLFNDTHGHLAGNQVLQEIAARILSCAREMDFVARYGGEEFAMLLPQCDLAGASAIADRIRARILEEEFAVDGQLHKISISGGCAQFRFDETPNDFICRADEALYRAKRNGRNRIEDAV